MWTLKKKKRGRKTIANKNKGVSGGKVKKG